MRRPALSLLLAISSLAFAPAPLPRPQRGRDPAAAIEGEWDQSGRRARIARGRLTYLDGPNNEYEVRLYPWARPPAYTLRRLGAIEGWHYEGIYRLEGDTLTFCYNGTGRSRPTSFDQNGCRAEVFVRVCR
jgi:uncharacterized protein (TIGR03067 family)